MVAAAALVSLAAVAANSIDSSGVIRRARAAADFEVEGECANCE